MLKSKFLVKRHQMALTATTTANDSFFLKRANEIRRIFYVDHILRAARLTCHTTLQLKSPLVGTEIAVIKRRVTILAFRTSSGR